MNTKTNCSRTDALHSSVNHISLVLLTVGLLLTAPWPAPAQINLPLNLGFREDRILVKPKAGADLGLLHAIHGIVVLRQYPDIGNLQVLQLPVGIAVDATIALYNQSGLVEYAERDLLVRALLTPNDAAYSSNSLWGLHNIGQLGGKADGDIDAPEAWDILHDATDVIVAVIDSGIRSTHEDLAPNMWVNPGESGRDSLGLDRRVNGKDDDANGYIDDINGINAINGLGQSIDDNGHGTHVAGTIGAAGNNSVGIVGVAWRVQLMTCKFLNAVTDGSISDAIECIDYARSKEAKIINASWGWYGENSLALRDAIQRAGDAGIIFVAACGNSAINNDANPLYPASFDLNNIIAVAATTRADQIADWSSYGATTVDLAAPGEDILSCAHTTDISYKYLWGTSMAAPHVAGACALLWSRFPSDTHHQVIDRLLSTTDPLPSLAGKCVTGGRLNLNSALLASDEPVITLADFDPQAFEAGTNSGVILFHRTGDPSQAIDVSWTFSGAALNGSDFEQLPTTDSFPAGADAYLTIIPIDDAEVEGTETVIVTLVDGPGYRVGSPNTATVTISDNDGPPLEELPVITLSELDPEAWETGPNSGAIGFHRTGDPALAIEVSWTFSGTASNGSDFQQSPTSSPFPPGADAHLPITPIDDAEYETNETVIVTLLEGPGYRVGSPNTATVTIADNDLPPPPLPIVTVIATDAEAAEPGNTGMFTISRVGTATSSLTVSYTLSGTGDNGADYQALSTSVTIAAGSISTNITVNPIDDSLIEGNEAVILTIATNSVYTVGAPNSATVTIADNDQPPPPLSTVTVTATLANAAEPAIVGIFAISRSGSTASSLTVNYAMDGTAQNGTDYQPLSGSVTIAAGASLATIALTPIDDTAFEGSEAAVLTISTNALYTVGSPSSATVTIADNDQPPPPLVCDFTASRLLGIVPLLVEFADTSTGNPVSWNWNFGDGSTSTAKNPSHIYLIPGNYTVTLTVRNSAGSTSIKSKVIRATLF